jgi:hypothetical protein
MLARCDLSVSFATKTETVNIWKMCHTEFVATFMIDSHKKSHVSNSNAKFWSENPKGRDHAEDLAVDRKVP